MKLVTAKYDALSLPIYEEVIFYIYNLPLAKPNYSRTSNHISRTSKFSYFFDRS